MQNTAAGPHQGRIPEHGGSQTINERLEFMKVTGIIMECNPFHEGHAYILREARRLTQADYIVVAMSGDFVQRGEPAVFDKYIRADQILQAGADLVLEIPLYAACGSAEYFARGGITLFEKLGVVTDLCFGSESGDLDNLLHCAELLTIAEKNDYSDTAVKYRVKLQEELKDGKPFPAAREAALQGLFEHDQFQYPSTPNDLLGLEYCRALLMSNSPIRPHAISRIDVPSATERRSRLLSDRKELICREQSILQTNVRQVPAIPISPDDFSDQLMYSLKMQESELESFLDVSPDLAIRIRKLLGSYSGFTSFCDLIKTKNLTRTRVSRSLLHILLQIRQDRLNALQTAGLILYARPLALSREAASLMASIRQKSSVPFLSKMSEADSLLPPKVFSYLEEELRAEDLYCLTLKAAAKNFPAGEELPLPVPGARQRKIPVKGV